MSATAGEQIRLSLITLDLKQSRKCGIFLLLFSQGNPPVSGSYVLGILGISHHTQQNMYLQCLITQ